MYEYICGKITDRHPNYLVIENNGIGYKIFIPLRIFDQIDSTLPTVKIFTYHHHREDQNALYGFLTLFERDFFTLLLSVSGIGPKLALKIFTELDPAALYNTIIDNNLEKLKKIKGLGPKTAAKLLLDLGGKIEKLQAPSEIKSSSKSLQNQIIDDTFEALKNLGYKDSEIKAVVKTVFNDTPPETIEESIRQTLVVLSGSLD